MGFLVGGFQLWAGFQQADMINQNALLTERVNESNAKAAEIDAWEAEKLGYSEVARYATVVDGTIGSQKTAFASEDVDVSFGTALDVQTDTKIVGMLNAIDIQKAAHNKALGFKREASNIRLGSTMQRAQSDIDAFGARIRGIAGAASAGISGFPKPSTT